MSEAIYSARANANAHIIQITEHLTIDKDDTARWTADAAERFIDEFRSHLAACYNESQPGEGMTKLGLDGDNVLTVIKSTDRITPDTILRESKTEATRINTRKAPGDPDVPPKIETRADAKVEADDRNYAIQATIGTKEGSATSLRKAIGNDIVDQVTKHSDGRPKTIDEWRLANIFKAITAAAKRPTTGEMIKLKTTTLRTVFDFRNSLKNCVERFRTQIGRVTAYKMSFDQNDFVLVILNNIHRATQHDWGRDFREVFRSINQQYAIDHKHDDASLQDVLDQLQKVDSVRDYSLAPAPEQANAVASDMDTLLNYVQKEVADFEEAALGVSDSDSDSDSSRGTKRSNKSNKSGRSGKDEKEHRRKGGRRGRSTSQRSRSPSPERRWQDNPCKHCRAYKRRNQHKNIKEKDCYFNKNLKVFRPKKICEEVMEIPFVPRYKFEDDDE